MTLRRILTRIHTTRGLDIAVECPSTIYFRGERQDLEEMAGNLMDNACKWAKTRVLVEVDKPDGRSFRLVVADDGPGLALSDHSRVMDRCERLDESAPGSGLGLSIVRDIAKLYAGSLALEKAEIGGLAAELTLPALW
jgi:signal transduction histidine kinase